MIRRRKMRLYRGEFSDILKLILSGKVAKGSYVDEFESKFAQYIGTKHAIATCTGRNGMELIFEALGLEAGDEIILPAYTLRDLVYLIRNKGYVPVLVDIKEDTFNIDLDLIEKAITPQTKVIIATHMFGAPCMIEKIKNIGDRNKIFVIEDCAHAAGAESNGKKIGAFGDAAFFSFETIKPINTFGGGMVTTNHDQIAKFIRKKIKNYHYDQRKVIFKIIYTYIEHFILHSPIYIFITLLFRSKYFTHLISKLYLFIHGKSRINRFQYSNLQALMGLRQLQSLNKRTSQRQENACKLYSLLNKNIVTQEILSDTRSTYYFFVIRTNQCFDEVRKDMLANGVDVSVGNEITDDCSFITGHSCPATKRIFEHAVQVPLYDELNSGQINRIAQVINQLS